MRNLSLIILVLLCLSCATEESATKSVGYFDIEKFNEGLHPVLRVRPLVQKTVSINDEKETKQLKKYDLAPELSMMNKFNINKPSFAGKYDVQTYDLTTTYSALEDDLITQKLIVEKEAGDVVKIEIHGFMKSILSESTQTIVFAPEKSFHLISEDKNRFNKDLKKEVLIEF